MIARSSLEVRRRVISKGRVIALFLLRKVSSEEGGPMIKVLVEAQAGSRDRGLYDEQTLVYKRTRKVNRPYPYPYGFIMGTRSEDREAIDCYIITSDPLKAGTVVECQPIGLLEQSEDEEIDNKVLATIPGQTVDLNQGLLDELRDFIYGVFRTFPDTEVRVGSILSKTRATEYINRYKL